MPFPPAPKTNAPRGGYAAAYLCLLLASLILTWPWISGRVTIPWDAMAHSYPQLMFLARALHSHQSPFWTPNEFTGHPQIADPQSLIFSPPYFLLAWFDKAPGFAIFDAVTFAMLVLGGISVIAMFRDRNWHPAGALAAALGFAFGGSAAWRVQHINETLSLAWFGITLFLLNRALMRKHAGYGALAGIAAGCLVLDRDQVALIAVYLLVIFVVWQISKPHWLSVGERLGGAFRPLLAGFVTGGVIVAVPLALTIAFARMSNRPAIDLAGAELGSLHPAALLTFISANVFGTDGPGKDYWGPPSMLWGETGLYLARNMLDIYTGALPFMAFLVVGLCGQKLWSAGSRFFVMALVVVTIYAFGEYTPIYKYMFALPGADLYRRPADATFEMGALFALLCGFLVHLQASGQGVRTRARALVAGALLAGLLLALMALSADKKAFSSSLPHIMESASLLGLAGIGLWLLGAMAGRGVKGQIAQVVLVMGLMVPDLAFSNGPNESTALPPELFDVLAPDSANPTLALIKAELAKDAAPDRRDRVELAAVGFHWPNLGLATGIDHDLGYNPLRLELFNKASGANDHIAIPEQKTFSPLFASYHSTFANMLGLRVIATGVPVEQMDKKLQPGDLQFVTKTADAYVYINPNALPRVLVATHATAANFDDLLKSGNLPDLDYTKNVLLEQVPVDAPLGGDAPAVAKIIRYENTRIDIHADAPQGGWLVLNDVWQAWWRAKVDGQYVPILRANVMFRAVQLSPGSHDVTFEFDPFRGVLHSLLWPASSKP
ncbi:MAG: hypothetical protein KGQ46_03580 [Hyphomicrobiales bacterium]|nr:hypothetical protein [Hyphomicrobiales bacterium]MDE2116020.1 hypothetical protein [Hyphomicrobiales bacterium]